MTDNSVFSSADQPSGSDNNESALNLLVGEGKKFSDPESLAKGKLESDRFIEQLQSELKGIREELAKNLKVNEALNELEKNRNQPDPRATPEAISPEQIAKLVDDRLTDKEKKDKANRNVEEAERQIVERLGSREAAEKLVTEKAKEMGVSGAWLMSVAATNPKALLSVLGLEHKREEPVSVTPNSSVNTTKKEFAPNGGVKPGTKEYFDHIRRTEPNRYWSSTVQNEIFAARKKGTYQTS